MSLFARNPKTLGFLIGLTGLAYLAQGWTLGSDGFSAGNTTAILAGYVLMLAWTLWLTVLPGGGTDSVMTPGP